MLNYFLKPLDSAYHGGVADPPERLIPRPTFLEAVILSFVGLLFLGLLTPTMSRPRSMEITIRVFNPDGSPAASEAVFQNLNVSAEGAVDQGVDPRFPKTDSRGAAKLWMRTAELGLFGVRDEARKLIGFATPPGESRDETVAIRLGPECSVTGEFFCDEFARLGKPLRLRVELWSGLQILETCDCDFQGQFQLFAPPGSYILFVSGDQIREQSIPFTVPEAPKYRLGAIELMSFRAKTPRNYDHQEWDDDP